MSTEWQAASCRLLVQQQRTHVERTLYGRAGRTAAERRCCHRQSGRRRGGQHVVEVWRRGRRQHLVGQHRGLVRDAVFHRQPVQRPRQRRCVCATTALADDAGEVVLSPLQLNDGRCWCAVQQGVAVVKPGRHDTARHCLRHLIGQQTAYVM